MRSMPNDALLQIDLPGIPKVKSGKVREIFDLDDRLLMVATDRISAFDVIMPNGIPRKGEVLTQISFIWFDTFAAYQPNHLLAGANHSLPARLQPFTAQLARRSMIVKKAKPLPIECVVRGYLAGSGWKEYQKFQTVCGLKLPAGLKESAELPEPVFTPATKAESGHDENIHFDRAAELAGAKRAEQAREASLKLYHHARDYARERGIIIADTKFEFGRLPDEKVSVTCPALALAKTMRMVPAASAGSGVCQAPPRLWPPAYSMSGASNTEAASGPSARYQTGVPSPR